MKKALASFACIVSILIVPTAALASYPGEPGRLAFAGHTDRWHYDVYSLRLDGEGLRRLTPKPPFATDDCPSYDPTGTRIAFCSDRSGSRQIWVMDADGTHKRQVTEGRATAEWPDFSPSGHRIVYNASTPTSCSGIWVADLRTGRTRKLTGVRPDPPGICTADLYPVFSPRGGRIAFVRSTLETAEIWVMNADGSNPRPLTTGPERVLSSAPIDWSPDGRKIAFLANPPDHINGELYVMNADGTGLRQLTATPTDGENGGVAWSPDGRRIAFIRVNHTGLDSSRIVTIRPDGTDERVITPGSPWYVWGPTWQPLP